jgi:hypothetical protein
MIGIPQRLQSEQEGIKISFDNFDWSLRCASPGIIESFDATTQTVRVKVAIKEFIRCCSKEFLEQYKNNIASIEVPLLVDVPICVPSAGGFSLTMPIEAGDECLLVFSDTCFDAWFAYGGIQEQMSLRRHDLSDAFAIVGIKSQPNVLANYSTTSTQLRNIAGTNYIELSDTEINLVFGSISIKIDASGITCNGNVLMNNNLDVKQETNLEGTTTIEEKGFLEHVHGGVTSGGSDTTGVK